MLVDCWSVRWMRTKFDDPTAQLATTHGGPTTGCRKPLNAALVSGLMDTVPESAGARFDQLVTSSDAFSEQDAAAFAGPWTIESS